MTITEKPPERTCAGVILAGGRSSRMGQNKALLDYKGKTLAAHMEEILLQSGCARVYVSGTLEGFFCIPDDTLFEGPASAIRHIMNAVTEYDSFLFVPVDMPFLIPSILRRLINCHKGAYYQGWPLPLFLEKGSLIDGACKSVKDLIAAAGIGVLPLPEEWQDRFININTPQDWEKAQIS